MIKVLRETLAAEAQLLRLEMGRKTLCRAGLVATHILASFPLCPKNLSEAEFKDYGLMCYA